MIDPEGLAESAATAPDEQDAGEPVRRERLAGIGMAAGIGAAMLAIYWVTGAPGSWWGDGLELTCAAKLLGISHPTGYPIYMLMGHGLMSLFGWVEPGRVMTLFSSVCCALAVGLLGLFLMRLARSVREWDGGGLSGAVGPGATVAGMMILFGSTRTLWEQASFAEVYPLTLFFNLALLNLTDHPGHARLRSLAPRLLITGLVTGLAGLNHYSISAAGPVVLAALIQWGHALKGNENGAKPGRVRAFLPLIIFCLVAAPCLLGYLYLPLRAQHNPLINWGDPSNWERVKWVLRGGDYGRANFTSLSTLADDTQRGLIFYFMWIGVQFLPISINSLLLLGGLVIFGAAVFGLWQLARRRPALGIGLGGSLALTILYPILYHIPDLDAYLLPTLPPLAAGLLVAGHLGWRAAKERWEAASQARLLAPLAPFLLGFALLLIHYPRIDKSWDNGPEVWAEGVLASLPQHALIITQQSNDAEIFALWYAQMVKGKRPDVSVFGAGFVFSGWYRKYFESEGRPKIPVFIKPLVPGDKGIFDKALFAGTVFPNLRERRVFATYLDDAMRDLMNPKPVMRVLPESYYEMCYYRLNPPNPVIYELHPDPASEAPIRAQFIETFGEAPPG